MKPWIFDIHGIWTDITKLYHIKILNIIDKCRVFDRSWTGS